LTPPHKPLSPTRSAFPADFVPLRGTPQECEACGRAEGLGFRFDYAYQPIVDLHRRGVFAHEALVRGPEGEGAMTVLSQVNHDNRYRFDQACRVKAIKGAAALELAEPVSINFLPNAIYKPEVCIRTTLEAARTHGFPLDKIIFEVTEGERIEDGPWFAEILREYKRSGFQTAIDDFGAGYAGMKLLSDFQPDIIKIDMDLVRRVDVDRPRQAIVRSLVRLCEELGIRLVAEGVETFGERDFLFDTGIHLMQGYLFARPAFKAVAVLDPAAMDMANRAAGAVPPASA
jgi:EAL domain-containing protein (putative c-di-GMP-specific phosphodiesterase class I)